MRFLLTHDEFNGFTRTSLEADTMRKALEEFDEGLWGEVVTVHRCELIGEIDVR